MMNDSSLEAAYDRVIDALAKTKEGKIAWKQTAESGTYLAAVRGVQTFEVSRDSSRVHFGPGLAPPPTVRIVVRDTDGDVIFDTEKNEPESSANKLFEEARRVAAKLDEKIDESLELLNSL